MSQKTYSIGVDFARRDLCDAIVYQMPPVDFGFRRWVDADGKLHHEDISSPMRHVIFARHQLEEGSLRDWLIAQGWTPPPQAAQDNEAKALGLIEP